eukprot:scaffold26562_cov124-Skeletonema_marinoi.AAC.3
METAIVSKRGTAIFSKEELPFSLKGTAIFSGKIFSAQKRSKMCVSSCGSFVATRMCVTMRHFSALSAASCLARLPSASVGTPTPNAAIEVAAIEVADISSPTAAAAP